uniref:DUF4216 domain-containing protein n=1 Tax=Chenopodium quinoa TaxID=63459 RepID=A0A803MV67_CHEQI
MRRHLIQYGIDPGYNPWTYLSFDDFGEVNIDDPLISDEIASLVRDDATNATSHEQIPTPENAQSADDMPVWQLHKDGDERATKEILSWSRGPTKSARSYQGDGRGIKRDKDGTISVSTTRRLQTNEPFVLASQVGQVYYVSSHNEPQWQVVIKTFPRNFYYFPIEDIDDIDEDGDENVEGVDVEVVSIAVDDDGNLDDEAAAKLLKFQQLHEKEIQKKGFDNLSVPQALLKCLYLVLATLGAIKSNVQHLQNREAELLEALKRHEWGGPQQEDDNHASDDDGRGNGYNEQSENEQQDVQPPQQPQLK